MIATTVRALAAFCIAASASAGELVVNANASDPAPRKAWEAAVARFERANPDVKVGLNISARESYKRSLRNWLASAPPDVVFWFAGERMRQFVRRGLLEDVSDLFAGEARSSLHPLALAAVSCSMSSTRLTAPIPTRMSKSAGRSRSTRSSP